MSKYFSFFKLRFFINLQYKVAALSGIITQFAWGFMQVMIFKSLYNSNAERFPMSLLATNSYIWLQQAFLPFFMFWFIENETFETISNGNIAYELCRPIDIYNIWFINNLANRTTKALLRCWPVLLTALFLPDPYGLMLPNNFLTFLFFVISSILSIIVTVSLCMFAYIITFYTLSPLGIKTLFLSLIEFFSGAIIPLPFFPNKFQKITEFLPFASMQNVPFRIYVGNIVGISIFKALALQLIWILILIYFGKKLCENVMRKIVLQGG